MKSITLACCAALFFIACNSDKKDDSKTASSTADNTTTEDVKPLPEVDSATQMKNWQEYMTPGPMHPMMATWNGTWEGDVTFWMPGAPEQKSKSTTENKMIMNGLYQESIHTGDMMGMPFNGRSTL